MAENEAPLLRKVYFEDCPGCQLDQRKESRPGLPFKEFFFIWIVVLAAVLPVASLFPFLYFMIRDFHIAKAEEDIGFYAGFVGASYMLGRALTSYLWGIIADRYGRKPVIVIGMITIVIFNTLFGLSVNFWMAILMRILLGSLNGVLGPIKAYATEVCRPEYQALGLSLISTSWSIGLIIGPALGGFLAQPAEKFPNIFSKESLFGRFPYFLPCLSISVFATAVTIVCLWLPETLHKHEGCRRGDNSCENLEASRNVKEKIDESHETNREVTDSNQSLLMNWPLMSAIIVYCVFSLHDMAYTEIFSLWVVSPRQNSGMSYTTQDVGDVLSITGIGLMVFQLLVYPIIARNFGPVPVLRISAVITVALLPSYPFIALLHGLKLFLTINCASILKNCLSTCIITGLFLLQNQAVPQHQRGAANGISMTAQSLFKAVGPAAGGALLSWAEKRHSTAFLPGAHMVFFILNVVEVLGFVMSFKPFLAMRGE